MSGRRSISNSFNVITVDDPVSVVAQYAPTDNPSSSQIHDTWRDGDLYMRTKSTEDGATWSDWHKIVGENGGETDYSFAISSQLSSTNSSTPPSDCTSESSWHDTPQAVTSQKPYLWMRVKKKVWNESTQQYDVVSTSYARLSAESNYIADLDNEMDSIECNNLGYPKSAQTISTKATLYRGSTLLSSTIAVYDDNTSGAQYTNGTAKDGITISWNNTTGVINVAFATSTIRTEKEVFCIKLTATDSGQTIVRLLYLTVNCVRGTALYRLVPSTDTITKRKNGTRVPSGNITCGVQKIVNGVISTPAASEYLLKMKVNDGSEEDYDTVAVSTITSSIEYILRVPQTNGTIVDRERVPLLIDGNDGINAFVVDLENEMKNVALTEGGNTLTAVDFYFKVQAFYGTTNVLSDNECTVSASCSDNNVTLDTTYAKTTGIRVQVAQNVALANSTDITVTVTHTTYGTRTVVFTLAGVRGGENAVLQELLPSLDAISFARQSDGSLTPASKNLDLSIKKTQGSQTIIQTIAQSGLTIRWSLSGMPEQPTSGSAWGQGTATDVTWSGNTMQIANSISAEHVCIAAFNSAGTLVDRETVPIVKDGQKGDNAIVYELVPDVNVINANADGTITTGAIYIAAYRVEGSQRSVDILAAGYEGYVAQFAVDSSGWQDCTHERASHRSWRTYIPSASVRSATSRIRLRLLDENNAVCGVCPDITIVRNGAQGKVGRFFYYEGEWNDFASTDDFDVTDAQAPYFHYDNNYWVFNPETNGTYTKQDMGTPSSSSSNWKLMTNDFKYIITEAIFGSYAHFGSAIINGDWLLSTNGTINGVAYNNGALYNGSPAYTWFDPQYPNESVNTAHSVNGKEWTGYNFVPNYAVDLLTGKSYQNEAYIKGQIVATSGSIDSISATNLNIKSGTITGDVTIGDAGVNIKLRPTGSGSGVGASIVAYDGNLTPFSLLFDRYSYSGTYYPHATLKLESVAPYSSKCGKIEIKDTESKRTLYYGSSQIPDYTYTLYEGFESITNFTGFVSKLSVNNAFHLRIGITHSGVACIIADEMPTANDVSSIPTGCFYRDGNTIKIKT